MAQHGATPVDYFTDNDVPSQQQLPPVPVSVCNPTAPATTETTQQPVRLFNTATNPGAATGTNTRRSSEVQGRFSEVLGSLELLGVTRSYQELLGVTRSYESYNGAKSNQIKPNPTKIKPNPKQIKPNPTKI